MHFVVLVFVVERGGGALHGHCTRAALSSMSSSPKAFIYSRNPVKVTFEKSGVAVYRNMDGEAGLRVAGCGKRHFNRPDGCLKNKEVVCQRHANIEWCSVDTSMIKSMYSMVLGAVPRYCTRLKQIENGARFFARPLFAIIFQHSTRTPVPGSCF